jgi:hypothetical protein
MKSFLGVAGGLLPKTAFFARSEVVREKKICVRARRGRDGPR